MHSNNSYLIGEVQSAYMCAFSVLLLAQVSFLYWDLPFTLVSSEGHLLAC